MSGDYVERLDAFANHWQAAMDDDLVSEVIAVIDGRPLRKSDLRAALDELERLRTERIPRGFLAQAYANGWYDAIEAYRAPGWVEREAGWRKYLDNVDVLLASNAADFAPQQPERGGACCPGIQPGHTCGCDCTDCRCACGCSICAEVNTLRESGAAP